MEWYIYKHTSPSGKSYIGMTSKQPEDRWQKGNGYAEHTKFGKAILKYGWDNFSHEILEKNIQTLEEAKVREQYYIALFDSYRNGYNSTLGGDCIATDLVPKRQIYCFETKEVFESTVRAAEAFNTHHSTVSRACRTGIMLQGKHLAYLDEIDDNWQPRADGRTNISKMRPILCHETGQVFQSVREASRQLNIAASLISRCCNKKIKSTHGYHFDFIEQEKEKI